MEQMLTTHTTCSQLAVHYSDFQLKVTLKFRMTTITRQYTMLLASNWREWWKPRETSTTI